MAPSPSGRHTRSSMRPICSRQGQGPQHSSRAGRQGQAGVLKDADRGAGGGCHLHHMQLPLLLAPLRL